jgi:hypothetical protein
MGETAFMSGSGLGCVKTCASRERAELFSPFSSFDCDCQCCSFPIQRNRDKRSTRKFAIGVFTQPGSFPDIGSLDKEVRFTPKTRLKSGHRTMSALCQLRKSAVHSTTSSARASNVAGISRSSVLAVLRLITSSNLVGCTTGRSAGRSPLRMRPV